MSRLFETQVWFGSIIRQPLQTDHSLPESVCSEAAHFIAPSPTLTPHKRLEIYHQQYWWRLLDCLQNNFPFLTKLLGADTFNQKIGIPYLSAHPPSDWALCKLGQSLPLWLAKQKEPRRLVDAARIDAASEHAFWCEQKPTADFSAKKLHLQPFVHLFELEEDLFEYRDQLLLGKEIKVDSTPCYRALYRNRESQVRWKPLTRVEYSLLRAFELGSSIEEACSSLRPSKKLEELIVIWFREWTYLGWFTS